VLPRFYFIDDTGRANAFSDARIWGEPGDFPPDRNEFGTVLFGITLLKGELRATPQGQPPYTVTAILAHELGHTLQRRANNPLPVVHKELQADFMAGWTIKFMQRRGSKDVDEGDVFSTFYKRGDTNFYDPNHHGTRTERLAAFLAGYGVEDDDVQVAYQKGEIYVRSIPLQGPPDRAPNGAAEFFAPNLGIYYVPIPYPDGTFGLSVSRAPDPNSPGGKGGLEKGDVILMLDSMPVRNQQDVLNHTGETPIVVIDVKTGQRQEGVLQLP
jgi:hypothetical protein